ncbi:MAG: AMP-binding protein [Deltaproteobacteria bacterium]|nr:AMP-binding protein [Deltaproteobacteria bacterium]
MANEVIWKPSAKQIREANVTAFMKRHEIKSYKELIQRCTTGIEWFWDSCVHETNISWSEPYTQLVDGSHGVAFAKWFVGGRLNITENCVDRHAANKRFAKKTAVVWQGECGARKTMTYQELFEQTNRVANFLKASGIQKGDMVALYLPMIAELIPIYFAILKVGAVVVPIFSGFGAEAVSTRLNDAQVKMVFTCDASLRRGKEVRVKEMLDPALENSPSVSKCVVVRRLFLDDVPLTPGRDVFYDEVMSAQSDEAECEELPSDHECMVIYTSGTTGKPKGTVHTHAGTLAQVTKEFFFNFDVKPKDTFFWVTDIGWMMGPWEIIGTTHFGATLVICEGAPHYPQSDRVLTLAEKEGVTHLGVSPTLVRLWMRENPQMGRKHKMSKLRVIGSTGEPWDNDAYMWCFEQIGKKQVPIMNISGGTELMGCLLAPLIIKELKACSLQSPGLGMAVDVYTEGGYSAESGEVGYLVCKKPAPSMTKGFLGDRQRYLDTYFSRFKNIWNHGDWAVRDEDGQWFLRGRADDTIKIAGKRTGPSEIESCLCDHPFVNEACAIGIPDDLKGESLVCFAVLRPDIGGTAYLNTALKKWVMRQLGKTLKPSSVYFVSALPKTRSGKIVRGTIKKKYLGQDVGDLASVENPDLLEGIPVLS